MRRALCDWFETREFKLCVNARHVSAGTPTHVQLPVAHFCDGPQPRWAGNIALFISIFPVTQYNLHLSLRFAGLAETYSPFPFLVIESKFWGHGYVVPGHDRIACGL